MIRPDRMMLLRGAAGLALAGLCFMVWSLVDPRPVPIMAAMSVGQGLGTLSFVIYLGVVIADARRASRTDEAEPPAAATPAAEPEEKG